MRVLAMRWPMKRALANVELSLEALYAMRGEVDALGLVVYEPDTANLTLSNWMQSNPHHAQILPTSSRVCC